MDAHLLLACLMSLVAIIVGTIIMRRKSTVVHPQSVDSIGQPNLEIPSLQLDKLTAKLASALPNSVVLRRDRITFQEATQSYWAQQACEAVPVCVVQPCNAQELSQGIKILRDEFDATAKGTHCIGDVTVGLFAIRGGGHSPLPGASSTHGGVLIDLRRLNEVKPSSDGASVVIGAGAKWSDVSKVLDAKGLAVVGGRNSAVGVGGLTLGGKLLKTTIFRTSFG